MQNTKIKYSLLFSVLLCLFSCDKTKVEKEYFENGNVKSIHNYENNQLNGKAFGYYENGELRSELNYRKGLLTDTLKYYYEDGNLKNISLWDNGEMNGIAIRFYSDSTIESIEYFRDGVNVDFKTIYYPNGDLMDTIIYKNGSQIYRKTYDESGNILYENIIPRINLLKDTIGLHENLMLSITIPFKLEDSVSLEIGDLDFNKEFITDTIFNILNDTSIISFRHNLKDGKNGKWLKFNHKINVDTLPLNGIMIKKDFYIQ